MSDLRLFDDEPRPGAAVPQPDDAVLLRDGRAVGPGGVLLTQEQTTGVERRDAALMLVAGAGAGKTTVLVERIVRHVLRDGVPLGSILAITFTRRAAGELRRRVRARFLELGHADHARDVDAAWIMTIDGCCARILRAHAVVAGLDPAFTIVDDGEPRELREAAFARALDGFLTDARGAARADASELLAGYGFDALATAIWQVYDLLRSAGNAEPRLTVPAVTDPAGERAALARAATALRDALAEVPSAIRVDQARESVTTCLSELDGGLPADTERSRRAWRFTRQGRALDIAATQAYTDAVDAYLGAADDVACAPALALVAELLERTATQLAACKDERGLLDYDDLALRTRDLLREHPGIAAGYAARLTRILVDEFQDTNRLQVDVLEALGQPHMFTVGDALQSIYGFRNADVRLFLDREQQLRRAGKTERLASNFRSEPDILEVVNAGLGPALDHWSPLVPARVAVGEPPRVELLLGDLAAWNADAAKGGPPDAVVAELGAGLPPARPVVHAEARLVAERVAGLIAGGREPGEIVVLLRAGAQLALYERALEQAGVPAVASQGRDWWARVEVQDLLSHLRVLVNAADESALLTSLVLAGATSDSLGLLRIGAGREGLWDALVATATGSTDGPLGALEPEQRELLVAHHELLEQERAAATRLGPGELLRRALERTRYDERAASRPGGARRVANVRKLVRLADAFEARRGTDVRAFVDHAQAELDAQAPTSDAPVDVGAASAVRLMTVHAAKGLEFPVVVLADLGRQPPGGAPRIIVDPQTGDVGLSVLSVDRVRRRTRAHEQLQECQRARDLQEGRRVVHVGVTRAKDLLVLSGAVTLKDGELRDGSAAATPIAWMASGLLGSAAGDLRDVSDELRAVAGEPSGALLRLRVNGPGTVGRVLLRLAPAPLDADAGATVPEPLCGAGAGAGEPAGSRAPQFTGELSYSALTDYARCPYSWYLRRVLRLPLRDGRDLAAGDPGRSPRARERGTLAHALLEHADLRPGARALTADDVAERAAALGIELQPGDAEDQIALTAAFLGSPLRARVGGAGQVRREAAFAFALGDRPLVGGVIDLLAQEAGGTWLIVDYKSDHVEPADDLATRVASDYPLQRAAYALAALRAGAAAVEVVHFYLERPSEPVTARFTAADAAQLEAALLTASQGIASGEHPVAAEPHAGLCAECPGRGGLCSWPQEMTNRPAPAPH